MSISGVLVHSKPENAVAIGAQLDQLSGVEVHAVEKGKLVVVVEKENDRAIADAVTEMQHIDGVLNVAMVYHQNEA
ncbi:MAG: chaperone NapD [Methylococcales bacterium]|nr:chaperone NapD [Methylococcales bacterium]MBT7443587.1 chaperone NapD [Methylococcales bacterium]